VLKEIVEKGANHGDRGDPSDGIPACGDRGLDDIGCELKG
jgi:hypothetical protein